MNHETITIECTTLDLEHLLDGARQMGACTLILKTTAGTPVYLKARSPARMKGRPRKTNTPDHVPLQARAASSLPAAE